MGKGILVVVSGFSGVGKGTVVKELLSAHDHYALSVSATTRSKRLNEEHGKDYFFVTKDEFLKMIEENALIEYATYVDNYYGTPRAFVEEQLRLGKNVILEIEVQGARQIKQAFPDAVTVFIVPPSLEELLSRLTNRGRESEEEIRQRLATARKEALFMKDYDYLLVNDVVEDCAGRLHSVVTAAHAETARNEEIMKKLLIETGNVVESD